MGTPFWVVLLIQAIWVRTLPHMGQEKVKAIIPDVKLKNFPSYKDFPRLLRYLQKKVLMSISLDLLWIRCPRNQLRGMGSRAEDIQRGRGAPEVKTGITSQRKAGSMPW